MEQAEFLSVQASDQKIAELAMLHRSAIASDLIYLLGIEGEANPQDKDVLDTAYLFLVAYQDLYGAGEIPNLLLPLPYGEELRVHEAVKLVDEYSYQGCANPADEWANPFLELLAANFSFGIYKK